MRTKAKTAIRNQGGVLPFMYTDPVSQPLILKLTETLNREYTVNLSNTSNILGPKPTSTIGNYNSTQQQTSCGHYRITI